MLFPFHKRNQAKTLSWTIFGDVGSSLHSGFKVYSTKFWVQVYSSAKLVEVVELNSEEVPPVQYCNEMMQQMDTTETHFHSPISTDSSTFEAVLKFPPSLAPSSVKGR